jgi:site-specific DNA recombinase
VRAAIYARVSTEEQVEGYSIDAQRRTFQTFAKDRQWEICREYIDEGKSARTDNINKRPAFKEMVADALAGQFDVLVVHKLDRFARNLRITLEYFDKLSKAEVSFVSISENMDFSTPWGRLALTLLGGLAQFYSDNLSQETKKGWAERKEQGLYAGLLPFGAAKGDEDVPIPDLETYPGLKMA